MKNFFTSKYIVPVGRERKDCYVKFEEVFSNKTNTVLLKITQSLISSTSTQCSITVLSKLIIGTCIQCPEIIVFRNHTVQ